MWCGVIFLCVGEGFCIWRGGILYVSGRDFLCVGEGFCMCRGGILHVAGLTSSSSLMFGFISLEHLKLLNGTSRGILGFISF